MRSKALYKFPFHEAMGFAIISFPEVPRNKYLTSPSTSKTFVPEACDIQADLFIRLL